MENDVIMNNIIQRKEMYLCDELKKSIETLILYRSLYILKKKFNTRKDIIKKIYESFNLDNNENTEKYSSYQVSIENFDLIAKTVFEKCNILLMILNNPKDILLSNLFLNLNKKIEEMTSIFREIKEYILDKKNSLVKKYNSLFYEKKIKAKMLKDIIEIKQNKSEEKEELKKEISDTVNIEEKANINDVEEKEKEKEEDEEIQRKIVEYNRKGKIIKTYNIITNENLTLLMNKENGENEIIKQQRINQKERYFNFNDINESINRESKDISTGNKNNLLEIEKGKNYDNIIYIETLPLIIADFIQQFPFYCIIESEDELVEELNILFDKELIEKINNYEETLKNKQEKFINKEYQNYIIRKNKLENNIKIYENLKKGIKSMRKKQKMKILHI